LGKRGYAVESEEKKPGFFRKLTAWFTMDNKRQLAQHSRDTMKQSDIDRETISAVKRFKIEQDITNRARW
jgi:hypothetical protein